MLLCDGGTSYTKIYNTNNNTLKIYPSKNIVQNKNRYFDYATGHSSKLHCKQYINELITLAIGGLHNIKDNNFTLLDIGSRDMKLIIFENKEAKIMDWNNTCGGNMGFTLEILGQYYKINYDKLKHTKKSIPLACGLLGIEKIFDLINKNIKPEIAIARFIQGLAKISYNFAKKPKKLYLSGGLSQNRCFLNTINELCQVKTLGQDLLIKGLIEITKQNKISTSTHTNITKKIKKYSSILITNKPPQTLT